MPLEPCFSEAEIRAAVQRIAAEISAAYPDDTPLLVGVLKGAFVFLADLAREITIPCEIDFVRARSYGMSTRSKGSVDLAMDVQTDVRGRHVIVVEDIADTGLTMQTVAAQLASRGPESVERCALLLREGCEAPEYVGLTVGPGFVVGYGIDYAEQYRTLRDIRVVTDDSGRPLE